jgi:hypothetical protein
MSETPQETLTTYLHRGYIKGTLGPGEVREAIRAVLARAGQIEVALDDLMSKEVEEWHAYTTCTLGGFDNADRGCYACRARKALVGVDSE